MQRVLIFVFLIMLSAAHIYTLNQTGRELQYAQKDDDTSSILPVLPAPLLKIISLDYDGLTSDFLFLRSLVFIGARLEKGARFNLTDRECRWLYTTLDVVSDIDPYFKDTYYFGNAYLPWYAGMVREANVLLEKGNRYRDWDWTPPFFLGFNYFYFLQDNDKASEYLMEASRRPDASPTLASLASKMAFKANRTEKSIIFLEEILKKTDEETLRKQYKTRIEALRAVLYLEKAVNVYRKKFGRAPQELNKLIQKGIIAEAPSDPYGGKFYLDPHGAVKTTSEYQLMPFLRK